MVPAGRLALTCVKVLAGLTTALRTCGRPCSIPCPDRINAVSSVSCLRGSSTSGYNSEASKSFSAVP